MWSNSKKVWSNSIKGEVIAVKAQNNPSYVTAITTPRGKYAWCYKLHLLLVKVKLGIKLKYDYCSQVQSLKHY